MDYVTRVFNDPRDMDAFGWDALLAQQDAPTPFMSHAYLLAMYESGSATPKTGWTPPIRHTLARRSARSRLRPVFEKPLVWRVCV